MSFKVFVSVGYYLAIGDIEATLAPPTAATDANDGTPLKNTDRVAEFANALNGVSDKISTTSSDIDGGSNLDQATDYQVGVTSCVDYKDLKNYDTSTDAYVADQKLEMCSHYSSITVHTKPGQPTCSVETEDAIQVQLTITTHTDDVQTGTFTVSRDDFNYDYLVCCL